MELIENFGTLWKELDPIRKSMLILALQDLIHLTVKDGVKGNWEGHLTQKGKKKVESVPDNTLIALAARILEHPPSQEKEE